MYRRTIYKGTLIAVTNMERSKRFYRDVLDMGIVADFGANVQLEGGLFLQTLATWKSFIKEREVFLENNAVELYFEVADIDAFCARLQEADVCLVHPLLEHRWGQRVVRVYDPDRHIIEVAERIEQVVKRFYEGGMSVEQVAERMDIPIEYAIECLKD